MIAADTLLQRIHDEDWDGLEEAWLAVLEQDPLPLPILSEALEAMDHLDDGTGRAQAQFLGELLDEHLKDSGLWSLRLDLVHRRATLLDDEDPHTEILDTLARCYPEQPELMEALAERVGLHRAPDDIPKTWTKIEKLRELMDYTPGTVVWMEGKGAGRIADVNLQLGSFKVDLSGIGQLSVGFAAARKLLLVLPEGHLLRRRVEDPESLRALVEADPDRLAELALRSYGEARTATEIRSDLAGIVDEGSWTSFWNRVRKNPCLVALPGGRHRYQWLDSAGDAVTALGARFVAAGLGEKLDLLRTHGDRDPELAELMTSDLRATAGGAEPARAFEIGCALERAGVDLSGESWAPDRLLASRNQPDAFVLGLADRSLREDAYRRIADAGAEVTKTLAGALRLEPEAKLLELLAELLATHDPTELERAQGDLLTQPRRSPGGFTWLAEKAAGDDTILGRNPLRLFQQILSACGDEHFQSQRRRLLALADSGGTLPRLLPHFDAAQAAAAEVALDKAPGLEDFQKNPLRNALHLRFPELHQARESPLYTTTAALAAKREELRELLEVEIPANRKAIEEARELGDLRENFEYKSARQRHEYLSARATNLDRDLSRARPIDFSQVDPNQVTVGTTVRLAGDGTELAFSILGPWESDPPAGILSHESEMADRLLGLTVGASLEYEGQTLEVQAIEVFRPESV